jgi:hypothetical protein
MKSAGSHPCGRRGAYYRTCSIFDGALKEYGDKTGLAPAYRIDTMSLYPPLFKATVTFKGFAFEREAKDQKTSTAARDVL